VNTNEAIKDLKEFLIKNEHKLNELYPEIDNIYHRLIYELNTDCETCKYLDSDVYLSECYDCKRYYADNYTKHT
jgi:hypothetical protein